MKKESARNTLLTYGGVIEDNAKDMDDKYPGFEYQERCWNQYSEDRTVHRCWDESPDVCGLFLIF